MLLQLWPILNLRLVPVKWGFKTHLSLEWFPKQTLQRNIFKVPPLDVERLGSDAELEEQILHYERLQTQQQ